jgi:hypothetical protein
MRRSILIVLTLVVAAGFSGTPAQDDPIPRGGLSLAAELEVQQVLLEEDLDRYERLTMRRSDLTSRLAALYQALDTAIQNGGGESLEQLETLTEQVGELEGERSELFAAQRLLIDRIRERTRTIELLDDQLANMPATVRALTGPLIGTWDVIFLPSQQLGIFELSQTGTLINGTYMLDGGWTGSLQGTLINRKVYMIRIDSKKGRMMELEGYLADDGVNIRGTWLSYEVLGGDGARGQWSAEKRETDE